MNAQQTLNDPCPECNEIGHIQTVQRRETLHVRGKQIQVDATYFHCSSCNADFEIMGGTDTLGLAYEVYRVNHELEPILEPVPADTYLP